MSRSDKGTFLGPARGFSLIEVMIAVVILAAGLLALAALQGSLARASADAKARGRVAAMLTARMEDLRLQSGALGEGEATPVTSTAANVCDPDSGNPATQWLDCTREEANLGSLTVNQNVTTWSGDSTFTATTTTDPDIAQFKRITLAAAWTDATGSSHTLATRTDVSALSLVTSLVRQPDSAQSGGATPIVRQDSPATAGVIPIALGNGDSSASSNPLPEVVGRDNNQAIVGTRFNVLTYTPLQGGRTATESQIQKRFENDVIKCTCQFGAGGTNLPEIYRTAQWPAVWTGERYDVYEPEPVAQAPGQARASGPVAGVTQSPLCQECCRDHHDDATPGVAKFDPERTVATSETNGREKYEPNGSGTLVLANTTSGRYINSCRVIRVDGFWRTASDMYSRQFGLLETQSGENQSGELVKAKSGLPTDEATTSYTGFVKDYALGYATTVATTGNAPAGAQTLYDEPSRGLNAPTVLIAAPSNIDFRYVHGRGLYIDHLESDARQKIVDVLADDSENGLCPATGPNAVTDQAECILPYLPFSTINLTEIAKWTASDTNVLTVNSQNDLGRDPTLTPSGGATLGLAAGTANNTGSMRISNSGVAASTVVSGGVDPLDQSVEVEDAQSFQVGGDLASGDSFDIAVTGGGINPFLYYSIATIPVDSGGPCSKPTSSYRCNTNTTLDGPGGSVRIENYNTETTVATTFGASDLGAICSGDVPGTTPASVSLDVPTFTNFQVTAASIDGTATTSLFVALEGKRIPDTTQPSGFRYESTTANFDTIPAGALVEFALAAEGTPTSATIQSCSINQPNGSDKPWTVSDIVWAKPWAVP